MIRIAVPDLISNSYFPAIAAVELGLFKSEGLDASIDLLFPVPKTFEALRDGHLDFVVGSAHATLLAFPEWRGAKLLSAIAQHTYWFLVLRSDLNVRRGDLERVKGLRIGAAPGVDLSCGVCSSKPASIRKRTMYRSCPYPGQWDPMFRLAYRPPKRSKKANWTGFGPTEWVAKSPYGEASARWFST